MKKLLALISILAFAGFACELDKGSDAGDTITGQDTVTETAADTVTPTGYTWVRILDTSDKACSTNPGADIDAVAIIHSENIVAYGGSADWGDGKKCEKNTANSENEVLGANDEDNWKDADNKFLSLNGGDVVVEMKDQTTSAAYQIQKGDTIRVFEVGGDDNNGDEAYEVYLCKDTTCADSVKVGNGFGEQDFTVQ
jgi:hypothetical protein